MGWSGAVITYVNSHFFWSPVSPHAVTFIVAVISLAATVGKKKTQKDYKQFRIGT